MPDNPFKDATTLKEVVGLCAGAISVCWDPRPTGVFDSRPAAAFVDAAADRINELAFGHPIVPGTMAQQIAHVINSHSRENNSNTPDYLLAEYLLRCLEAYEVICSRRDKWYGIDPAPGWVR